MSYKKVPSIKSQEKALSKKLLRKFMKPLEEEKALIISRYNARNSN